MKVGIAVLIRPPWSEMIKGAGYIPCSCGTMLATREQTRDHWQRGHFDYEASGEILQETLMDQYRDVVMKARALYGNGREFPRDLTLLGQALEKLRVALVRLEKSEVKPIKEVDSESLSPVEPDNGC